MEKHYCVYVHYLDGSPIYVGSGNSGRPFDFTDRSAAWKSFVGKRRPEVRIVEKFDNWSEAREEEGKQIAKLKPSCNFKLAHRSKYGPIKLETSMNPDDVIKYFGSVRQLCDATGLSHQAVYYWVKVKRVSFEWQVKLEEMTKKKLERK